METEILAETLENFYVEARNARGELYSNNTVISIRHSLERYLTDAPHNKDFSIIRDRQFKRANDVLKAHLEKLSSVGLVSSMEKRKFPIADEDVKRLFLTQQLGMHTPESLVQTALFYFIMHSGRCAREYMSFVTADDFKFEMNSDGQEECIVSDSSCRGSYKSADGFTVTSWPNHPCCPVACLKKYLNKRNPVCPGFWQNPRDSRDLEPDDAVWFRPSAIGKNRLKGLVAEMGKKARLSTQYTCQNVTFTSLEVVKSAAIECGAVPSLRNYAMARQGESLILLPLTTATPQRCLRPILPNSVEVMKSSSYVGGNPSACPSQPVALLPGTVTSTRAGSISTSSFTAPYSGTQYAMSTGQVVTSDS